MRHTAATWCSAEAICRPQQSRSGPAAPGMTALRRSKTRREFVNDFVEGFGLLPLRGVAGAFDHLDLAAPQGRRGQSLQIAEIDDLLIAALHDRERDFEITHDFDFVREAAGLHARSEIPPRVAVGVTKIRGNKGRNWRIARCERRLEPLLDLRIAWCRGEGGGRQSLEAGKSVRRL